MIHIPRWKIILILGTCFLGILIAMPNLFTGPTLDKFPSWFPKQRMYLGLDLQGGSYLQLKVDLDGAMADKVHILADDLRNTLNHAKIGYMHLSVKQQPVGAPVVQFSLRDPGSFPAAKQAMLDYNHRLVIDESSPSQVTVGYHPEDHASMRQSILGQSREIILRRVDQLGTTEPEVLMQGQDRIVVQLPGVDDPDRVKNLLNTTAKLTFRLVHQILSPQDARGVIPPPGTDLLPSDEVDENKSPVAYYIVAKKVAISGESLNDAQVTIDSRKNQPVVAFKFDAAGGRKMGAFTRENLNRPFGIILDNRVISAPTIRAVIESSGIIEGHFTIESANDLALLMRAGALPASLTILNEKSVGPSLGADSIQAGKLSTMIAILLVGVFMVLAYGLFGWFANAALVFNIIFLIAGLSLTQSTLTLPGIAGIALTVGMAVDANVLIYERIKEELRHGRRPIAAIDLGYNRAMDTIIDSNVTTIVGAWLLFWLGTGPIKGFAITLIMGIVISMFTAISLNRLFVVTWFKWRKPQTLAL